MFATKLAIGSIGVFFVTSCTAASMFVLLGSIALGEVRLWATLSKVAHALEETSAESTSAQKRARHGESTYPKPKIRFFHWTTRCRHDGSQTTPARTSRGTRATGARTTYVEGCRARPGGSVIPRIVAYPPSSSRSSALSICSIRAPRPASSSIGSTSRTYSTILTFFIAARRGGRGERELP